MRHRNARRKLGRTGAHRIALMRNLVTALLDHEQIETTDAKAKELKRYADKMITLGKPLQNPVRPKNRQKRNKVNTSGMFPDIIPIRNQKCFFIILLKI
jgi:large subunit ribosomal protein L17